jgi:hypothetical protein
MSKSFYLELHCCTFLGFNFHAIYSSSLPISFNSLMFLYLFVHCFYDLLFYMGKCLKETVLLFSFFVLLISHIQIDIAFPMKFLVRLAFGMSLVMCIVYA